MHRSIFLIKYLLTSFIVAIHPCNSVITEAGIDVEGTNNYTSTVPCLPIDFVTGRRPSPSSVAAMIESAPSHAAGRSANDLCLSYRTRNIMTDEVQINIKNTKR